MSSDPHSFDQVRPSSPGWESIYILLESTIDLSGLDEALPPLSPSTSSQLPTSNDSREAQEKLPQHQEELELVSGPVALDRSPLCRDKRLDPFEDETDTLKGEIVSDQITRLPIEILERILTYTFLRHTPTTPYSDPFPLNHTSHLLLISHSFSSLALPIFYRSITISRPSHYQTFFDPERGLFVAGEEGRKRWSFVREICILSSIFPPLVRSRPPQIDNEHSWVVPLTLPKSERKLELACVMDRVRFLEEEPSSQPDVRRLVEEAQRDSSTRSKANMLLREEYGEDSIIPAEDIAQEVLESWSMMMYDATMAERIDELVQTNTELWIEGERERVFTDVLRCGFPNILALPHDPFTHEPLLSSAQPFTPILQLHLEPGSKENALEVLFDSVDNLRTGVGVAEVQLVGYSTAFLEELEAELESRSSEEAGEASTLSWSWGREDGTQRTLPAREQEQLAS